MVKIAVNGCGLYARCTREPMRKRCFTNNWDGWAMITWLKLNFKICDTFSNILDLDKLIFKKYVPLNLLHKSITNEIIYSLIQLYQWILNAGSRRSINIMHFASVKMTAVTDWLSANVGELCQHRDQLCPIRTQSHIIGLVRITLWYVSHR